MSYEIINVNAGSKKKCHGGTGEWKFVKCFKFSPCCFKESLNIVEIFRDVSYVVCIEDMCDHDLDIHGVCIKLLLNYGESISYKEGFTIFKGVFDYIHSDTQLSVRCKRIIIEK